MNNCECLKNSPNVKFGTMYKALKFFIISCLVVVFLAILTYSITDFSKGRTTYANSIEKSKTLMPSWTLCPWVRSEYSIPVDQVNERMGNGTKIPFNLSVYWEYKLITDEKVLNDFGFSWGDVWSVNCKFFEVIPNSKCIPCLTFTAPNDTFLGDTPVKLSKVKLFWSSYINRPACVAVPLHRKLYMETPVW